VEGTGAGGRRGDEHMRTKWNIWAGTEGNPQGI